jgi:hypothetical protein
VTDGIRIVDRTSRAAADDTLSAVEHLVTWQEEAGCVVVLGLDARCRPLAMATLYSYL